jgi:ABC-type maltose transport system permease subunit
VAQILTYTALVVTPLIVLFAIAQRWIVSGIRLTSWK